jgi:hypothetical protein
MLVNYSIAERLAASKEGLNSMELVGSLIIVVELSLPQRNFESVQYNQEAACLI